MKSYLQLVFLVFLFPLMLRAQPVESVITPLNPIAILTNTSESVQSKVWTYAGKHWCVLGTSAGTLLLRLDGTGWTNTFMLASGNFVKADIKVVDNVTHIVVHKGSSSVLYSVIYDVPTAKYKLWPTRPGRVDFSMEKSNNAVSIDIDANGRMWMASDGSKDMNVRWSDPPYSNWQGPFQLENNASTSDLCALVALPGTNQVGVFWSNKTSKRFAFKTHTAGNAPTVWSADEAPASAYALNIGSGFAEGQFHVKPASSGRLYAAIKTGYNSSTNMQIGLLVRQTSGTWDAPYPVTIGSGTNPILVINDSLSELKVIYTTNAGIVYRQSALYPVSFGPEIPLISGAYDYASSVKSTYNSSTVIIASNASSAAGVLIEDQSIQTGDITAPVVQSINRQSPTDQSVSATSVTYRVLFSEPVTGVDNTDFTVTAVNGTVSGQLASGAVVPVGTGGTGYDVTISGISGEGTMRLDLGAAGSGITDAAGNPIEDDFNTGQTYIIGQTIPVLSYVSIASNNADTSLAKPGDLIQLSFTASEALTTPTVTIAGRNATVIPGTGNSFTASITLNSTDTEGLIGFTINFASVNGKPGVPVSASSNGSAVNFDKTKPVVQTINRQSPANQSVTATSVTYRVVFSEPVSGVDEGDFAVTVLSGAVSGQLATGAVTPVSTEGNSYDVSISAISGEGTLRLDLIADGAGITDASGNLVELDFTSGQTYQVVQVAPVLNYVSIASNNADTSLAKPGDLIQVSFTASEAIATPTVTIAGRNAPVSSGPGNTFVANITLSTSDNEGVIGFTINFASLSGKSGVPVGATSNGSTVSFDKTKPVVQSINRQSPATQAITVTSVTYRVIFSEPVSGVDPAYFTVTTVSGAVTGQLASEAVVPVGNDGTTYDVNVSALSGAGTLRLDLIAEGTAISDAAGNLITNNYTSGQTYIRTLPAPVAGFASVIPLTPVNIAMPTKDKPQAKVWKYANKWWSVLSVSGATRIFRLDGTTWTPTLTLATTTGKNDVKMDGNLVHILIYKGANNNSQLLSVEYDQPTGNYKLWSQRPDRTLIVIPAGSETAKMALDGTGKLWIAAAGTTQVHAWYSLPPYTSFSSQINIASGIKDDDICTITELPNENKIAIIWSDQTTKRYGFRTHNDADGPTVWSATEIPANASALNVGDGMADDHLNTKIGSDGTLYVATKTGYNKNGYAKVTLLIRRPNGEWDPLHTVTLNEEGGTQPAVILNETKGTLKVLYASGENGGNLMYRESSLTNILFGPQILLIGNNGNLYDYISTMSENYSPEIVLIATRVDSDPQQAIGFLASDEGPEAQGMSAETGKSSQSQIPPGIPDPLATTLTAEDSPGPERPPLVYPNPFDGSTTLRFSLPESGEYTIILYGASGVSQKVLGRGHGIAGTENYLKIDGASLRPGLYLIKIQTPKRTQTLNLIRK